MVRIVIFNLILLLVCGYAYRRGGGPERVVATAMLGAAVATALVSLGTRADFRTVIGLLLAVDLSFFAALVVVAIFANRFWPLWIAALQLDAIAIHAIRAYDQHVLPFVYAWSSGQIAYPMLLLLAWGTVRHRQRLAQFGSDPGWTPRHDRHAARHPVH